VFKKPPLFLFVKKHYSNRILLEQMAAPSLLKQISAAQFPLPLLFSVFFVLSVFKKTPSFPLFLFVKKHYSNRILLKQMAAPSQLKQISAAQLPLPLLFSAFLCV
jgi:hypothetical protein